MNNPFSLEGKTILITGASSGIGKGIAKECAAMGATLILNGRNEARLNDTLQSLHGTGHSMCIGDLNGEGFVKEMLREIPKLDGLVLCAGFVEMWPVMFATTEKFKKVYDTNLFAPIELLRLVTKKKLYNPGFAVVAIDSIAGSTDFCVANGIYGSGKAALKSFLRFFALEVASKNIRINTISPGMILTPMHTDGAVEETKLMETINKVPLKRWGTPEDIAYAAIYLLSDASSYLTGTDITIDGGYTI